MRTRLGRALAGATATALLLAGCGGGEEPAPPETSKAANGEEVARADVEFTAAMLQRHAAALSVLDLTLGKRLDPRLQELVEELRTGHAREVTLLTTRLTDWGEEIPETVRDHVNSGHGHGEDSAEAGETASAEGARFTELWVPEMVAALEECRELAEAHEGHHEATRELAEEIVTGHRADIEALEELA